MSIWRAVAMALAVLLTWCSNASALNPALDVSQYAHTAWKVRDGFSKGAIRAMAQTSDGYLWLGTEAGLLRFDGVKNLPWQPPPGQRLPSDNVLSLLAARDGTLWIGTDNGLVSWKDGRLTPSQELAGSFVSKLREDREGSIWMTRFAAPAWSLCVIRERRSQCFGRDGGPGADAIGLYEDSRGRLWVGASKGLWLWKPGPPKFYPLPTEENGIQGLSEGDDGELLMSKDGGIRRLADGTAEMVYPFPSYVPRTQAPALLRDRDGGLWVGSSTGGLVHIHQGITDTFAQRDGLSGDAVYRLFEDQEGSVWVATRDGLDRFRESPVASYSVPKGVSAPVSSVLVATDGRLWVGTLEGVNRLTPGDGTIYRERSGPQVLASTLGAGVQSMFQDTRGRVWVSTFRGVGYLENDRLVPVTGLPGGLTRAIVEDNERNLWVANRDAGLFRMSADRRDAELIWNQGDRITALAADPSRGGLWLGFLRGGIAYFADGRIRASYGAAEGLGGGRVGNLRTERDGTLWVSTAGGLSRVRDGRVATLTSRSGLPCDAVHWTIAGDDRSLWVAMVCGLAHISRTEIEGWISTADNHDGAAPHVDPTVFEMSDGFRVFPNAAYYGAAVAKSPNGKLWFPSQDGLSVVDPRRIPFNSRPPSVQIQQVIADRRSYSPDSGLRLPPLVRDLQIDYTALSLVAPEKNQFHIMLEGRDRDWQDVGVRRQAIYNDLAPGHYRFRVRASNNSGVWNETGAAVDIAIAPAYYQTTWFLAFATAAVVGLVWGAHRVRLRIVERHEREISALNGRLMQAQEQERTRIAGELHDGVMQEMLAVTMMLGTAKRRIPDDAAGKATIDKAQQKLIQLGTDLRQLSHELHPPALQEVGLPGAVRGYCAEFSASSGVPIACDADEAVEDLSRGAALALFRILQEALGNAAKHARATRVAVRLIRSNGTVSLIVSDDGAGFDRSRQTSRGLGLITIRERASQLGGTFDVESAPGRGTTIRVAVPFR